MLQTIDETATRTIACACCGRHMTVERCFLDGRELFTAAKVRCADCEAEAERKRREVENIASSKALSDSWDKICPPRFRDTDPAKIRDQSAMNQIIGWKYSSNGLLALGETGAGKTRCFYMLLRRLHKAGRSIIAVNAADLALEISCLFFNDQSAAAAYIKKLCLVDVLYLDDLDKSRFSERVEAEVYHVINARTENHRPTLVTLNCDGEQLAAMLSDNRGAPIVRRLRDYCAPVVFKGRSPAMEHRHG